MDRKLKVFAQWLSEYQAELSTTTPFKGVFLAPEYYCTCLNATRFPMTEDRRLQIERDLLALSQKYPQILMVPGTVFYAKELVRAPGLSTHKFDPATGTRKQLKTTGADRRQRALNKADSYIASIPPTRTNTDFDLRYWVGSGYDAGAHHVPSLGEIRASLQDLNQTPLIARNAAYLLLAGRRIGMYDKQTDFGEAIGYSPDRLAFLPGAFKQCPEIGGYRLGTEICFDHANGMLARRGVAPLHFHFVSDWVENNRGNMAMSTGGYFAHASTKYRQSSLYRRAANGTIEDITTNDTYWKKRGTVQQKLDGYLVPLPAPLTPLFRPK